MRKGRLPIDLSYDKNFPGQDQYFSVQDIKSASNLEEHKAMEKILKQMSDRHLKLDARKKQLKFRPFKVGDTVNLKEPGLETQAKEKPIATGPYKIHKVMAKNTYKLVDVNGKKLKFLINGRRLVLLLPRKTIIRNTPADQICEYIEVLPELDTYTGPGIVPGPPEPIDPLPQQPVEIPEDVFMPVDIPVIVPVDQQQEEVYPTNVRKPRGRAVSKAELRDIQMIDRKVRRRDVRIPK